MKALECVRLMCKENGLNLEVSNINLLSIGGNYVWLFEHDRQKDVTVDFKKYYRWYIRTFRVDK